MTLSAFDDKAVRPSPAALERMLGRASRLWTQLQEGLQAAHGPLTEEWKFSGPAFGWSCRLKQKNRVLVYMTPCRAHFLASFALGEKACLAARAVRLSAAVQAIIDGAPKYAEGRGVRIPVRNKRDLEDVEKLVAIKAAGRS